MEIKIGNVPYSKNFLDKDFQKILFPMRVTQYIFSSSKFRIKHNCIRPNSLFYNIISLFGMLILMSFNLNPIAIERNFDNLTLNKFLLITIIINAAVYATAFISFYLLNVLHSKKHVEMILNIQKAFRIINYKYYKKLIYVHWSYVFRHSGACFMFIIFNFEIYIDIYFFALLYFDVNLSYGVTINNLLRSGMLAWMSEVEYHTKRCLELNVDENEVWRDLFQAYDDMMEAFNIFKNVFQIPILFTTSDTLFHTILYVQSFIEIEYVSLSNEFAAIFPLLRLFAAIWVMKNIMLIKMFSNSCERIYQTVEEVDASCCYLLTINREIVGSKRLCKQVLRLNRYSFNRMNACRVFTVDASLPKTLAGLVGSFTIVLLQFAIGNQAGVPASPTPQSELDEYE